MLEKMAIGIDLGTTYSCVGVFRHGKVEIISNDTGSRITPSFVAFNDTERLLGNFAKEQAAVNPKNTVFEAKRLIGRRFTDGTVQQDVKLWPFKVLDYNGTPKIKVQFRGKETILTAEEISAFVLTDLKRIAKTYIGQEVKDAVITVPAYFTDSQRQATIDAGKIAGLNVLSIINEPTAAALAYGYDKKLSDSKNLLIFDLGGGTFDVAVISTHGKSYDVKAVGGDTHLGGSDFDRRLVQHCLNTIKKASGKDLSKSQLALGRLRKACEIAKIKLSGGTSANIHIESFIAGKDFRTKIGRKRFEDVCSDLFLKTITLVESVVADSNIDKKCIDEVILVGGSSRIPKIQELLSKCFVGKKLNATINPDEAVAYGATLKAALLSKEHTIEEITLADVVPLSLGQINNLGDMVPFIKRNSRIPITVVQDNWTTMTDYQTVVEGRVFEGERIRAEDNNLLGTYEFDIGERELAGVPRLTYTFTVDENGILHVTGVNENTESKMAVAIKSMKGRLTEEEIKDMKQEVDEGTARPMDDASLSKEALERYCQLQKSKARALCADGALTALERENVVTGCEEALSWLEDNDHLGIQHYVLKLDTLKLMCSPLMASARDVPITSKK